MPSFKRLGKALTLVLLGVDETTFVTSVTYERTQATIMDYERTALTPQDRDVFLAALDTPAAPTDALREASALRRRMVLNGDGSLGTGGVSA